MFGSHFLAGETNGKGDSLARLEAVYREQRSHALLVARQAEKQASFLLVAGNLWPTCVVKEESRLLADARQALDEWADAPVAHGSLPSFALRAAKIWFAHTPPPESARFSPGDFFDLLGQCISDDQPCMLWGRSLEDEFFAFFPGGGKTADQVLDISTGELVSDPVLVAPLLNYHYSEILVERFVFSPDLEGWQEYRLHRSFCDVCENFLARYSQLVGRVMAQSLMRAVNAFARQESLPVEMRQGMVFDSLVLPDLAATRETYQNLLAYMLEQAEQVIGQKLVASILFDEVQRLPQDSRNESGGILLEKYLDQTQPGD
jgi:hypothetical protein